MNYSFLTLEDFIKNSDKLLSTLGIFIAIVALTLDSKNIFLSCVSFLSVGAIILVGFEVFKKIDKSPASLSLLLFRYILLYSGVSFILYWVTQFRMAWRFLLWVPAALSVSALIFWTFLPIVRKVGFTRWLFGVEEIQKKWYHKIVRGVSMFIIIFLSFIFGAWLAYGTNIILDALVKVINI